ncbi:xylulokinase [Deinococcus roseus]|uniref:Sugar kinase n=1 Tax=Deinococcus roseus TaxID=392414 RepID=A0ABQ2D384_9DEIO|nr:FGGY family carbohydrate kinase [Deinococcus roseus]GGJ35264.1 sugar kinase [Deinococcus roseus]
MFLGIDIGTGSIKILLMNRSGEIQAVHSQTYRCSTPQRGHAEMDPEIWWQSLKMVLQQVPQDLKDQVEAVGFSGQMHGLVLTRADGTAAHPAVLWLDQRSTAELQDYPEDAAERLLNPLSVGMLGPSLLWMVKHRLEAVEQADFAFLPKDHLRYRMGGDACTDPSDSTGTLLAKPDGNWNMGLIHALGLPERLFPEVRPSAAVGGHLSEWAAQELGLPAGIPLAVGAGDTPCAALGSGLLQAGQTQLTTGSGAQLVTLTSSKPNFDPALNAYRATSDHWYVMAAMQNAGVALEWVRSSLSLDWTEAYDLAFQQETSVVFLPHLIGERTPLMDPKARGAWLNLEPGTSRGELMRAALEGVAFSIRNGLEALQKSHEVKHLRLAGGGSGDSRWQQLLADVLQVPLNPVSALHSSGKGAAMLAAAALGHPFERWIKQEDTPEVIPRGDVYQHKFEKFREAHERLKGWFF